MDVFLELFIFTFIILKCKGIDPDSWDDAWSYDDTKAQQYWGAFYDDWATCGDGKVQSPVNLATRKLLYDPNLPNILLHHSGADQEPYHIKGNYTNTGKAPVFRPFFNESAGEEPFRISNGPLHYKYRLHEIRIHFGRTPEEGSEHLIDGQSFQGELHMTFWNDQLYSNFEKAQKSPKGLAIMSIFLQMILNETSHPELTKLTHSSVLQHIIYKGSSVQISNLKILELFPDTFEYVTYEGSMTIPPCYETVTWIILNRPIHISQFQLDNLRELLRNKVDDKAQRTIARNLRPIFPKGSRAIRTNIAHVYGLDEKCYQNRVEHTYRATIMT
ncbi:carbonic anhydrase-related protein 10-like [Apostichopus japonicus]|uniref:carbonic anhydrase-related protein 10-like n=1 Tax=Stichopus japonicus TaxID=307972 RepID=UPI003AB1F2FD